MKKNLWDEPDASLLERCKNWDEEALTEILVTFTPLVRYLAGKFGGVSKEELEDLIQEGYISIIDAVKGYERVRGKFSSYSFSCIRNRMISFVRKNRNKFYLVPLSAEVHDGVDYSEREDQDAFPDPLRDELFKDLTCLEATVLDAFLEMGSISRAALILGWPKKRVDNALQRIRRKILDNMGERSFKSLYL